MPPALRLLPIDTGKPSPLDRDEPRGVTESVRTMGLRRASITRVVRDDLRIFTRIRPAFRYERSREVLTQARAAGVVTKADLILGMGERRAEVSQALRDLHERPPNW